MTWPMLHHDTSAPRRRSLRVVGALLAATAMGAADAGAQALEPRCAQETALQDACQTAADLFSYLTPQLGVTIAGGSATLGQGGISGGFGRLTVALRATGIRAELPDLDASPPLLGAARQRTLPVNDQVVALPQLDVSIGIFRGLPLGLTNVGGLDLLVSGIWLPDVSADDLEVDTPGSGFRVGAGARLTILQETITTPGLAVTYMWRQLPTTNVTALSDGGADTVHVSDIRLNADSWRVMASKTFYKLGFGLGIGQDRYDSSGDLTLVVHEGGVTARTASPIPYERRVTRTNAFGDLSYAFGPSRAVLEVGRVWGGGGTTFNGFDGGSADAPRLYGSAGLRIGF